jgi:hypothetical protein
MTQVIRLKANFPEHKIQSIRLDNATEFSSRAFNDYCMTQGIEVYDLVPYVHTHNGLVESLIKRIKLFVRPLLRNCNLSITCWAHTDSRMSPDLSRGMGKSIGGDLDVDDEGSEQRWFEPMQSLHHGSVGYQPMHTRIGLAKKALSLQVNRELKQE